MVYVMRSIRAIAEESEDLADECVLRLEELNVRFSTPEGEVVAVKDFSLEVDGGSASLSWVSRAPGRARRFWQLSACWRAMGGSAGGPCLARGT